MRRSGKPGTGARGAAALEFALILPIMLVLVFGVVDFGRLIQARLIVANVSREGGSLVSRGFSSGTDLLSMLQSSGAPLDLNGSGVIYISRILAGTSSDEPDPYLDMGAEIHNGNLGVSSSIRTDLPRLGLSEALYERLRFDVAQEASDIKEVWVVQVYYKYIPVTPLPSFVQGVLSTPGYDGIIIGSRAFF